MATYEPPCKNARKLPFYCIVETVKHLPSKLLCSSFKLRQDLLLVPVLNPIAMLHLEIDKVDRTIAEAIPLVIGVRESFNRAHRLQASM